MRYGGLMEELRWKQRLAGKTALSCAAAQTYVERMEFDPLLARKMMQQQQQLPPQQQPQRFLTFEKTPNYVGIAISLENALCQMYEQPKCHTHFSRFHNFVCVCCLQIIWPHVPKAIAETCPWKPKIVIMLRNPVDRLYSHYQMHFVQDDGVATLEELLNQELQLMRRFGLSHAPNVPLPTTTTTTSTLPGTTAKMAMFQVPNITKSYRDEKDSINFRGFGNHGNYLRLLYRGMYYFQLERWLEHFELGDNLLVILYEQFKKEPDVVMHQVYTFVGASTSSFHLTRSQLKATYRPAIDQENRKEMVPAPPLAPSTRRYLEHFYRPYNERLSELLGGEWRGVWERKEERER
jgi:Sulfotransferase domain